MLAFVRLASNSIDVDRARAGLNQIWLLMKGLTLKKLVAIASSGAVLVAGVMPVKAGDKIIVSDDKGKSDPRTELKTGGGDLFKAWEKLETPGFDYSVLGIPTIPRGSIDSKLEKRLRNEADQQRNWLILPPGELQRRQEEEDAAGGRTYTLRGLDKKNTSGDYTFDGIGEEKNRKQQRQPGEMRMPSKEEQAQVARQREREEADNDNRRTFTLSGSRNNEPGHTASELNFSKLFDPGKKESFSAGEKSEFSLRNVLETAPVRTKDQQVRMDKFNEMINASPGHSAFGMANPLSLSKPAGSSGSVFSRPLDPVSSKPAASDLFRPSPPTPNRLNLPGLPTLSTAPTLASPSGFQQQPPPASDSSRWMRSTIPDPPRRKF